MRTTKLRSLSVLPATIAAALVCVLIAAESHAFAETPAAFASDAKQGDELEGGGFEISPLTEFRFEKKTYDIEPRDWFANYDPKPQDQRKSVHIVAVEPACLSHNRLYFEDRAYERCGCYDCTRIQTPRSAAHFFSRAILFPGVVLLAHPRDVQQTNLNCP